jgi:hypothetical protein
LARGHDSLTEINVGNADRGAAQSRHENSEFLRTLNVRCDADLNGAVEISEISGADYDAKANVLDETFTRAVRL